LQELEETSYWLELLVAAQIVPGSRLESLQREAGELTAIFASTAMSAKRRKR
jgi:hypothetical protein